MRVLITGSSDQLGAAIAEQLSAGHEPVGIDLVAGKWTQHVMSITDRAAVFQVVRGVDAIFTRPLCTIRTWRRIPGKPSSIPI